MFLGSDGTRRSNVSPSGQQREVSMRSVFQELSGGDLILGDIPIPPGDGRSYGIERPVRAASREDFVYAVRINRTERVIGWYPSFIAGESQPYFSSLELDWLQLLDVTPGVARLKAQPLSFKVRYGGEWHRYTPDTEAVLENGLRVMIEVKPFEHAIKPECRRVWKAIRERLAQEGIGFKIVTDRYLKIRQRSALALQAFNTWTPDPHIKFHLSVILGVRRHEQLGKVITEFPNPVLAQRTVMSLVRRRSLLIDLSKPIDNDLEISMVRPEWL